jgi:hypothetical protein
MRKIFKIKDYIASRTRTLEDLEKDLLYLAEKVKEKIESEGVDYIIEAQNYVIIVNKEDCALLDGWTCIFDIEVFGIDVHFGKPFTIKKSDLYMGKDLWVCETL